MAALLALVAFTVYFATNLILRPLERNHPHS
jgi:HAMP domain-containing protein